MTSCACAGQQHSESADARSRDRAFRDQRSRDEAVTHLYCDCSRAEVMTGSVEYSVSVAVGGAIADDDETAIECASAFSRVAWTMSQGEEETEADSLPDRGAITARCRHGVAIEHVLRNRLHGSAALVRGSLHVTEAAKGASNRGRSGGESRLARWRGFVLSRYRSSQSMRSKPLAMPDCVFPTCAAMAATFICAHVAQ